MYIYIYIYTYKCIYIYIYVIQGLRTVCRLRLHPWGVWARGDLNSIRWEPFLNRRSRDLTRQQANVRTSRASRSFVRELLANLRSETYSSPLNTIRVTPRVSGARVGEKTIISWRILGWARPTGLCGFLLEERCVCVCVYGQFSCVQSA